MFKNKEMGGCGVFGFFIKWKKGHDIDPLQGWRVGVASKPITQPLCFLHS